MKVLELPWVLEVDLQSARSDPARVLHHRPDLVLRQPHEVSNWEGLAHCPPVKVVGVQVLDEGGLLLRFGLRIPVRYHGNSSANAFLEEQVHIAVR